MAIKGSKYILISFLLLGHGASPMIWSSAGKAEAKNLFENLTVTLSSVDDAASRVNESILTILRSSIDPRKQPAIARSFEPYAQKLCIFIDSIKWEIENITPPRDIDLFFEQINHACNFEKRKYIDSIGEEESAPFRIGGKVNSIFIRLKGNAGFRNFITKSHILSIIRYNFYDDVTRTRVMKNFFSFILQSFQKIQEITEGYNILNDFVIDRALEDLNPRLLSYNFLS